MAIFVLIFGHQHVTVPSHVPRKYCYPGLTVIIEGLVGVGISPYCGNSDRGLVLAVPSSLPSSLPSLLHSSYVY